MIEDGFFYCAETRASHRISDKLCKQTCSNLANEDGKLDAFAGFLQVSWWHLRKHFSTRSHEVHVLPDSWFTTSKHLDADEMGKIHFDASCWFKGWVQRWDSYDKACSTEHAGDICDCLGDFGCWGWLTRSGFHETSTSFDSAMDIIA